MTVHKPYPPRHVDVSGPVCSPDTARRLGTCNTVTAALSHSEHRPLHVASWRILGESRRVYLRLRSSTPRETFQATILPPRQCALLSNRPCCVRGQGQRAHTPPHVCAMRRACVAVIAVKTHLSETPGGSRAALRSATLPVGVSGTAPCRATRARCARNRCTLVSARVMDGVARSGGGAGQRHSIIRL